MTIQPDLFAQAVIALWLFGLIHLWNETAPRERYIDQTREEQETEWITNWIGNE